MKKYSFFFFNLVLACLLLSGCNSDNDVGNTKVQEVTLLGSYDNGGDISSRTVLDASNNQLWSSTDAINVNGTASTKTSLSTDKVYAAFTVAAAPPYYAFYPGNATNLSFSSTNRVYTYTFPATQAYNESGNSFSDGVNPMVATTTTTTNTYLSFSNVCGILKAQIKINIAGVCKVRFLSADKFVAGTATVTPSRKTLTVSGTTLSMDVVFSAAKALATTSPLSIYWVLPTGSYGAGWTIQLLDSTDNVILQSISGSSVSISRSCISNAGTLIWQSPSTSTPSVNDDGSTTTTVESTL